MAIKRKPPAHENHERWLVSYADFITLLFAFFVVMFASSQTDKAKARQISEAVEKALEGKSTGVPPLVAKILGGTVDDTGQGNAQMRGPGGAKREAKDVPPDMITELIPSLKKLSKELEEEIQGGKLEVRLEPRGLVISLRQSAFFPSGTDEMPPNMYPTMAKVAGVIGSLKNSVQIEGHTDSIPIHNARFNSNWELSAARAIAVLNLFTSKYNLPETRFAVVGRADTVPVDTNDTDEGRKRNRRVDIVIVDMLALKAVSAGSPPAPASSAQKH
ncbi:MAG TPA: flagellar motor protein MotB [Bryobacteraceae bacterium]|nr:flagellar motor protein MotB [Bryobacteraceae bacterium]